MSLNLKEDSKSEPFISGQKDEDQKHHQEADQKMEHKNSKQISSPGIRWSKAIITDSVGTFLLLWVLTEILLACFYPFFVLSLLLLCLWYYCKNCKRCSVSCNCPEYDTESKSCDMHECTCCHTFLFLVIALLIIFSAVIYYPLWFWLTDYGNSKFYIIISAYHTSNFLTIFLYKEVVFVRISSIIEKISPKNKTNNTTWWEKLIRNFFDQTKWDAEIETTRKIYDKLVAEGEYSGCQNCLRGFTDVFYGGQKLLRETATHLICNSYLLNFWYVLEVIIIIARIVFHGIELKKYGPKEWYRTTWIVVVPSCITYIYLILAIVIYVESKLFIPLQQYIKILKQHLFKFTQYVEEDIKQDVEKLKKFMNDKNAFDGEQYENNEEYEKNEKNEKHKKNEKNLIINECISENEKFSDEPQDVFKLNIQSDKSMYNDDLEAFDLKVLDKKDEDLKEEECEKNEIINQEIEKGNKNKEQKGKKNGQMKNEKESMSMYNFNTKLIYLKKVADSVFNKNRKLVISIVMQVSIIIPLSIFRYYGFNKQIHHQNIIEKDLSIGDGFRLGLTIATPVLWVIRLAIISNTLHNIEKKYIEEFSTFKILINGMTQNRKLYQDYSCQINDYIDHIQKLTLAPKLFGVLPLNQVYFSLFTSGVFFLISQIASSLVKIF